jgi:hypothetical protein
MVGVGSEGFLEVYDGFVNAAAKGKGQAEIGMHVGIIGIKFEGFGEIGNGFLGGAGLD